MLRRIRCLLGLHSWRIKNERSYNLNNWLRMTCWLQCARCGLENRENDVVLDTTPRHAYMKIPLRPTLDLNYDPSAVPVIELKYVEVCVMCQKPR